MSGPAAPRFARVCSRVCSQARARRCCCSQRWHCCFRRQRCRCRRRCRCRCRCLYHCHRHCRRSRHRRRRRREQRLACRSRGAGRRGCSQDSCGPGLERRRRRVAVGGMGGIHERFERFEAPAALAVAACRMGWVGVGGGASDWWSRFLPLSSGRARTWVSPCRRLCPSGSCP